MRVLLYVNLFIYLFIYQGDAEREQGLPVSAYMDRNEPQVAKLQDSFVAHLVKPLVQAMQTAGLLPVRSLSDADAENDANDDTSCQEPELIINIEENHKYWKNELGEIETIPVVDELASPQEIGEFDDETEPDSSGEMETIEEDDDENV